MVAELTMGIGGGYEIFPNIKQNIQNVGGFRGIYNHYITSCECTSSISVIGQFSMFLIVLNKFLQTLYMTAEYISSL